jgi:signal transduction histidine kinase
MGRTDPVFRYALAVLAAVAALFLRVALTPLLGNHDAYHTVWLGVVFSAWYCGLGPSIVTSVVSALGVWYFLLPKSQSWAIQDRADVYGLVGFLVFSGAIIALGESNRRGHSARSQAEEALKDKAFSARLLQLQDEERRHIARELHDGVGQLLALMSMNAAKLDREKSKLPPDSARCAEENSRLIEQVTSEIRTISYLFHPPLLDDMGLRSALKWYVEGFADRSKIATELQLPDDWERLSQDHELCLFRITQECLTNIHRHSGSFTASVRLLRSPGQIKLEVSDEGKGLSKETQSKIASGEIPGVGLRGMRERVRQLGGSVEIRSNGRGTSVIATLPFEESAGTVDDAPLHDGRASSSALPETTGDPPNVAVAALGEKATSRAAKA